MFSKLNLKLLTLSALITLTAAANKAKIYSHCLKPGQFVLTFDDGPNPDTTPIALEVLNKYNIKGAFFINSYNWSDLDNDPNAVDVVKKIYAAGHDIGSHTFYHKDLFSSMEDNTMKENVDNMTKKIESIIGLTPAYFRPPCGKGAYQESDPYKIEMSDKIQKYLGERGYSIIMWGTDTRDSDYKDVDKVIESLNEQLADPSVSPKTHSFIALLHDVRSPTVNVILPAVIEYVQSLGYTFVSLSECIGVPPYREISKDESNKESNLKMDDNDDDDDDTINSNNSNESTNKYTSNSTSTNGTNNNTNDDNNNNTNNNDNNNANNDDNNNANNDDNNNTNNYGTTDTSNTTNDDTGNTNEDIDENTSDATTLHYSMFFSMVAVFLSYLL